MLHLLLLSTAMAAVPLHSVDPLLQTEDPPAWPGAPDFSGDRPVRAALSAPELTHQDRHRLGARGLYFVPSSTGEPVEVGGQWLVEAPRSVLRELALEGHRLYVGRPLDVQDAPTQVTGPLAEFGAAAADGTSWRVDADGDGVAILDIDSDIDPFHPHLFRADGGAHRWVDVDDDGVLEPDVDGVDLDGDGTIDDDEVLRLMDSWYADWDADTGEPLMVGFDGDLHVDGDYLWLDTDGDGVRGVGGAQGFSEDDPAYGEPIFLPDDADLDGVLGPDERLLRLDSSRLRVVWAYDEEWRRGEDLVDYPVVPEQAMHGTGVVGLMTGGPSRAAGRVPGLLDGVDILVSAYFTNTDVDQLLSLVEAENEEVDVVLHEYATWIRRPMDGSDPVSLAIDDQSAGEIVHVCPSGNAAAAGKHSEAELVAGQVDFAVQVEDEGYAMMVLELHTELAPLTGCTLRGPGGESVVASWGGLETSMIGDQIVWTSRVRSERDVWTNYLYAYDNPNTGAVESVQVGRWTVECTGAAGTVHAYVGDDVTGWARGIWLEEEVDFSTLCWPSVADSCIAVGAFAGRTRAWDERQPGQLMPYSSRGPRIFDDRIIDVTAPTDGLAPTPSDGPTTPAEYMYFGGTSGAGPHVAAAAARLKQLEPDLTGLQVRERVRDTAAADSWTDGESLPGPRWGHGKLQAHTLLFGVPLADPPEAPVAIAAGFEAVEHPDGCRVTVAPVAAEHPDATFRWDWGYDGTWDGGFESGEVSYVLPTGSRVEVRLQAESGGWWVGEGLGVFDVPDVCEAPLGDACTGCAASPGGAGLLVLLVAVRRRRRVL